MQRDWSAGSICQSKLNSRTKTIINKTITVDKHVNLHSELTNHCGAARGTFDFFVRYTALLTGSLKVLATPASTSIPCKGFQCKPFDYQSSCLIGY